MLKRFPVLSGIGGFFFQKLCCFFLVVYLFGYLYIKFYIIVGFVFIAFGGNARLDHCVYGFVHRVYKNSHVFKYFNNVFSRLRLFFGYRINIGLRLLNVVPALFDNVEYGAHLRFRFAFQQRAGVPLRQSVLFYAVSYINGQLQYPQLV